MSMILVWRNLFLVTWYAFYLLNNRYTQQCINCTSYQMLERQGCWYCLILVAFGWFSVLWIYRTGCSMSVKENVLLVEWFLVILHLSLMITPLGGYFPFTSEQFGNISLHDIHYTCYFSEQSPTFIVKKYIWIIDGLTKQDAPHETWS